MRHQAPMYQQLLDKAIESPCGIAVRFDSNEGAKIARQRLYNQRLECRTAGITDYDHLTFRGSPYDRCTLWIIKTALDSQNSNDPQPQDESESSP